MIKGIQFNENKLFELIPFSYHSRKQHGIAVSLVEYEKSNNLNESNSAPISSK